MNPRTKAQREALELSLTLPALSARDKVDAIRGYAHIYAGARKAWCSCCGHVWESNLWNSHKEKDVCPHCGARGKVVKSAGKRVIDEKYYVTFVRVVKGWQVLRTAICTRVVEKGDCNIHWTINEVFQRWMRPNTIDVVIGRGVHGLCGYYCDVWNHDSLWCIRNEHYRFELEGDVCGRIELHPIVRRNGVKAIRRDIGVKDLLWSVMHDERAEILAKGRQWAMLKHMLAPSTSRNVSRWWGEIRVAMRNGYHIKDASLWVDMVDMLHKCGKDVRNPHYICPADLNEAHDAAMMMNARRGEAMHHCVFRNGYYKKEGILILSARKAGIRLETIEVDTTRWKIIQCRGRFNQDSSHHKAILNLMEKNMNKLRMAN